MLAIQAARAGGPEVLEAVDLPVPEPGPGEIRIRHEAIGLNFIDTYHRSGLYPVSFPAVIGSEGAGVVEAVGEGVTRFKVGDRAGHAPGPLGAYAEAQIVPEGRAVFIDSIAPSSVKETAAGNTAMTRSSDRSGSAGAGSAEGMPPNWVPIVATGSARTATATSTKTTTTYTPPLKRSCPDGAPRPARHLPSRREALTPRNPMTPTAVPRRNEVTASRRWTQK